MSIIERLISGYPSGDVAPQDFIDHLSIGADGWVVCLYFAVRGLVKYLKLPEKD